MDLIEMLLELVFGRGEYSMLFIGIIIVMGIIIHDKNQLIERLEKEIVELKKQLKGNVVKKEILEPKEHPQNSTTAKEVNIHSQVTPKTMGQERFIHSNTMSQKIFNDTWDKINSIKSEPEKKQFKNTILLALGAFFIVVAAISFLYSTWYTVPDFLKTCVILVLAGVFLGISHVADKVFDLKKTASTFFYIAMAYIPICLTSISAFGFVGEYLSFKGDGKFIYLSLVTLLVSSIYLAFGYKHNDEKLYYASKFMQIVFVACLVSIATVKPLNILCVMLAYTIILNILNNKFEEKFLLQAKFFDKLFICIVSSISIVCSLFAFNGELVEILLVLGSLINAAVLYVKENRKEFFGIAYVLAFLLLIETFMYNKFGFKFMHYQIATFIMLLITTFYYNFREKDSIIRKIVNWTNLVVMCLIYLFTIISDSSLDFFVLGVLGNVIAFTSYIKNNKEQYELFSTSAIVSSIFLLLPDVKTISSGINFGYAIPTYTISFESYIVCMISSIAMFGLLFKDKNQYLKIIPLSILFINLYRYQWLIGESFDVTYYLNIVLTLVFAFLAIKDRKDIIYRATSFVFLIGWFVYAQIDIYVATLITIIFGIIQSIFAEQNIKNVINTITTISLSLMYIVMVYDIPNIKVEAYILSIISSLVFWYAYSRTKYVKLLPMLGLIIPLFNYDIIVSDTSNLSLILNICTVLLFTYMSFTHRKQDEYKLVSFVYIIALVFKYHQIIDIFTASFIVVIWSLIQMLISSKGTREILKGLILTTLIVMYVGMYIQMLDDAITTKSYALTIITSLILWGMFANTKYLKALPMLGLIIPLFNYNLTLLGQYDITFIVNLAMVGLFTYISIICKEENIYKGISFIYLGVLLVKYNEMNIYIKHFMLIIWSICELLYSGEKLKDIFKALITTTSLSIYIIALNDLKLIEITAFLLLGFLVYAHVITRLILKKYLQEYKVIEYAVCVIIYLIAFSLFRDGVDLAIFIAMQVFVLMVAYARKYGSAFAVTVPAIIINTFYLTQNFWLAIPWWAYLIVVGGTLIVFAARNELSEKQDINTIKEKLNKVRNYLDM